MAGAWLRYAFHCGYAGAIVRGSGQQQLRAESGFTGHRRWFDFVTSTDGHPWSETPAGTGLRHRRLRVCAILDAAQDVAVRRDLRPEDFRLLAVQRENLA